MHERRTELYTIGHSNHPLDHFLDLLRQHQIELLIDVRSYPKTRIVPHFNSETLRDSLTKVGIRYVPMGNELGGRPNGREFYDENGYVLYDKLSRAPFFLNGLGVLRTFLQKYRVAIMCSEENPNQCHRRLLICRVLAGDNLDIEHIRGGGNLTPENLLLEVERREQLLVSGDVILGTWRSPKSIR